MVNLELSFEMKYFILYYFITFYMNFWDLILLNLSTSCSKVNKW
jgi:hypothetical protein